MTTHAKPAPTAYDVLFETALREPGISIAELATKVRRLNLSREMLERLRDAFTAAIAAPASNEVGLEEWGPAPGAAQLAAARELQEHARQRTLSRVLDGALTREQVASRLGVTPQAVSERLKGGKLIAVRRGREWRFPAWQLGADDALPGLSELVAAWPGTPVGLSTWATTPTADLDDRTPAEVLGRRDGPARAIALAEQISAAAW